MFLAKTTSIVRKPSKKIKIMLEKALKFVSSPKDPTHGVEHVKSLLKNADKFLKEMKGKLKIDRRVLLLAIYWHDVWKSQNRPTLATYIAHQMYEGYASMVMFQKEAKIEKLSQNLINEVSYAIRKHSAFQILPSRTNEAKLLWDIDTIDMWNAKRYKLMFKGIKDVNLPVFDSSIVYMKKVGFNPNFDWTKKEIEKRKPKFFKELEKFRENYVLTLN